MITTFQQKQGRVATSWLILIIILALMISASIPGIRKMQQRNEQRDCATTLTEIVIAKEAYAVKHSLASNVPITMDELLKDNAFNGVAPVCPAGGSYTIGSIDQRPTCSIDGHQIEWVEATPMPIISSQTAQTSPRSSVTLPQTSSETIVTTNSTHATE